jgi:2-haloacid dehalogenase
MPLVIAFDVNETLLDLAALDPLFERDFGDAAVRVQWFGQMLQLAFVGGLTGRYVDFTAAQRAALAMVAERHGAEPDVDEIVGAMRSLPPHPEVPAALERLRGPLAALTNSPLDVARDQLRNAGIADRFDAILSADQVRALKPRPEPYQLVASTFGVSIGDVVLVAAHAWDIAGALSAGARAAFVARPGMVLSPVGPQPEVVGADLTEVADQLERLA